MGTSYRSADGSTVNVEGLGYALMKGHLSPEDVSSAAGGIEIRGRFYAEREE